MIEMKVKRARGRMWEESWRVTK